MRSISKLLYALLALMILGTGCQKVDQPGQTRTDFSEQEIKVVATTSMIADLVQHIGAGQVSVTGLMGPGVDPHLYKASEGDVVRMADADIIFYNGIHLEGKMTDVFEQMQRRGIQTIAVAEGAVDPSQLLESAAFAGNYDPHVWFDVSLWMDVARYVQEVLSEMDPSDAEVYEANTAAYLAVLEDLEAYVREQTMRVPEEQRVIITSHDAFGYFGRAYGYEVRGLQGISTATEAGTADVQALAAFVAERRIPALFVESSVSSRGIEAVRAAVRAKGFDVGQGGTLFSDALGDAGTPEGTYTGMVRHNVNTIVEALSESTVSR